MTNNELKQIANTIRGLAMDGVQKANSGHPGLPMGMADVAAVLYSEHLKFNPKNPKWLDRDRFVLSGGHGSMLLYSLLHLYGYDVSMDDLKNFRQWHSKTPGHPELQDTPGVETTTGPLGQGIANAVGMALAESMLHAKYGEIVNHHTYVMCGDGDLQEGISHEACSFAGHNKLGKLIMFYDSNDITIDGDTHLSYSEDTRKRFKAYGWHVQEVDGHDYDQINEAIEIAKQKTKKPSIIICKTVIGFGSPNKQGKEEAHGAPLGQAEIVLAKQFLRIPPEDFYVPEDVVNLKIIYANIGEELENTWNEEVKIYHAKHPEQGDKLLKIINNSPLVFEPKYFDFGTKYATRNASGKILEQLVAQIDTLVGGSADLTPSNKTYAKPQTSYSPDNRAGNYVHYGVREFGMGGIMNGMALHGGILPYGGTFFVFSDYMRSSVRMAALMGLRVVYVWTHDSIGLGEDGPTHQPIEHLSSLRAIPNMVNFRPMDANETVVGWQIALERTGGPTSLILTRQDLPTVERGEGKYAYCTEARKGGYVLTEDADFDCIIVASGSEVEIALNAKKLLNNKGKKVRIVSMPSTELFDTQPCDYKKSVFPCAVENVVAVEAAASLSWYKYTGRKGKVVGIDRFGASAPFEILYDKLGITPEKVVEAVESFKA